MTDEGAAGSGWRTSTRTGNNANCVEVAPTPDAVLVRDSKDRSGPVLGVGRGEWLAFVAALRDGEFDDGKRER